MNHTLIWVIFLASLSLLAVLLLRNRYSLQWLAYLGMNVVIAAVLLYTVNWFGARSGFHLPINIPTLSTIGLLGVPGLMLLVALKFTIVGLG